MDAVGCFAGCVIYDSSCVKEGRHLRAVLAETAEVTHLGRAELERLETPGQYLGSAEAFRNALASESNREDDDKEP
jgi:hypothetical protein